MATYFGSGENAASKNGLTMLEMCDIEKMSNAHTMGTVNMAQAEVNAFYTLNSFINDPVALGFKIFFNYTSQYGLLAPETSDNSAIAYLTRIGEDFRAQLLKIFIAQLQAINQRRAYMFQSLNGLDIIRQHKPWERYGEDAKLTIEMLEDLTFSTQSLMSIYKEIWYDSKRGVEVLPANLRRFDCSVYIFAQGAYKFNDQSGQDIDKQLLNIAPNILKTNNTSDTSEISTATSELYIGSPDLFNHIVYNLSECEFLPWESQEGFHKASNVDQTIATNNITFSFRWCGDSFKFHQLTGSEQISADFLLKLAQCADSSAAETLMDKYNAFVDSTFGDSTMGQLASSIFTKATSGVMTTLSDLNDMYGSVDALKSTGLALANSAADAAVSYVGDTIASKISSLFLGNVYDFTTVSSVTGALSGGSFNDFANLVSSATGASFKSSSPLSKPAPNVYTGSTIINNNSSSSTIKTGANVYNKM